MPEVITTSTDVFTTSAAYADTEAWHATVTPLRQQHPVVRVEGTHIGDIWAVLGHAEVLEVERQHEQFTNGPASSISMAQAVDHSGRDGASMMKVLIEMDGAEHMAHRLIVNKWFLPSSIRNLDDAIEARVNEALDAMEDLGGSCDFARDIAMQYPLKVILSLFGLPDEDFGIMLRLTEALMAAQEPDATEQASMAMIEFFEYFQKLVESRKANPTDDLASLIANSEIDGEPISDLGAFGLYLIVVTAGHDTTSGALAGGMDALLANPDQLEALRNNPDLAANAADEMIRWVSPVKHFLRNAQADYELAGMPIKAGDRLLLSYPSANRDERVFDDPFAFDVSRNNASEQIAFGFGRHYCLGVHLAKLEIRKFFEMALPRISRIEATGPCVNLASSMVSGPTSLPVSYSFS